MSHRLIFLVGRLHNNFATDKYSPKTIWPSPILIDENSLKHGAIRLVATDRPITGRCLTWFAYNQLSISLFAKIVQWTIRPSIDLRPSIGVCQSTWKKFQMLKYRSTDDGHTKLSIDGRRMLLGCSTDFEPSTQTKYNL